METKQYKESVMTVGGDSVGKTSLLLEIASFYPDNKCLLLDFENKVDKILDALYPDGLPNLEIMQVRNWDTVVSSHNKVRKDFKVGDWYMIDGLDKAWDIAQGTWEDGRNSEQGPDQWNFVKRIHNKDWLDKVTGVASFNVAATAMAAPNAQYNIDREKDPLVVQELMQWKQIGFRPGGEKRNTSRFDTVFPLKAELHPRKYFITTYKDKFRPYMTGGARSMWMEFDFPFWPQYKTKVDEAVIHAKEMKEKGEYTTPVIPLA